MRVRSLARSPFVPFAAAALAVIVLPLVAARFTWGNGPGDYESGLRAHVAWSRVIALVLVGAGAWRLARVLRERPASALRGAVALMLAGTVVAGAFMLPFHDDAVRAGAEARYAGPFAGDAEWEALDAHYRARENSFTMSAHVRVENHTGGLELHLPEVTRGDTLIVLASYPVGPREGVWDAQVRGPGGNCRGWSAAFPSGNPTLPGWDGAMSTTARQECTLRGHEGTLIATAGVDEPLTVTANAILEPVFVNAVLLRLDASLVLVGAATALSAFTTVAHVASRRELPDARRASAVLAVALALVSGAWAVAAALALAGHGVRLHLDDAARASLTSFLVVAGLAAGAAGGLGWAIARHRGPGPAVAVEWAATGTAIVLVVAPAAATRAWLREGPGAMLAFLLTLIVAVSAFVAARVMRNARADAADGASGAESGG